MRTMVNGMNSLEIGSRVLTAKGIKGIIADTLEGGYLLADGRKVRESSIASVIAPPPAPDRPLKIGDRLHRNPTPKTHYPKKWHEGAIDDRPATCGPIATATIVKFSDSGYWVLTPEKKKFHITHEFLEDGVWEPIDHDENNN
jgi:hypothetical protein